MGLILLPHTKHYDLGENIMEKRIETYEKARVKHLERWLNDKSVMEQSYIFIIKFDNLLEKYRVK